MPLSKINAQQPEIFSLTPSHCMRCKQNFHFDSALIRDKFDFIFCSKSEIIKLQFINLKRTWGSEKCEWILKKMLRKKDNEMWAKVIRHEHIISETVNLLPSSSEAH